MYRTRPGTLDSAMKMLKIKEDTHKELTSVLGELTARDGEIRTYDDVLKEVLAAYKRGKSNPSVRGNCRRGRSSARRRVS